jgi:hypothetical protein
MLIASTSKAHTVHRKQKEEELFVLKWKKERRGPAGKVSKAPSSSKSTLQTGASQTHIRTVPASENCEVATLPFWGQSRQNTPTTSGLILDPLFPPKLRAWAFVGGADRLTTFTAANAPLNMPRNAGTGHPPLLAQLNVTPGSGVALAGSLPSGLAERDFEGAPNARGGLEKGSVISSVLPIFDA